LGGIDAHTNKAKHNERFLSLVEKLSLPDQSIFPDWVVTISFYVALQWVDAKLAAVGTKPEEQHPGNHWERNTAVASCLPKDVARDYFFLKGKSEYARYIPGSEKNISQGMVQKCMNLALTQFIP